MTTFETRRGNLLESGADCLVNATNTRGVMGAGIAAQFRKRWPEMFADYRRAAADDRQLEVGQVHVWWNPAPVEDPREPRVIFNLHTKDDPSEPSRYLYVIEGLQDLAALLELPGPYSELGTVAVPALGCGLGGLDWAISEMLIREILGEVERDLEVWLYPPRRWADVAAELGAEHYTVEEHGHTPWAELKRRRGNVPTDPPT